MKCRLVKLFAFVLIILPGCNKKEKNEGEAIANETTVFDEILGVWEICLSDEDNGVLKDTIGPSWTRRTMDIKDNYTISVSFLRFKDENCSLRYTDQEVDTLRDKLTTVFASLNVPVDERSSIVESSLVIFQRTVEEQLIFRLGKEVQAGVYELDIVYEDGEKSYFAVKIIDNEMYLSLSCNREQVEAGICNEVSGMAADKRSFEWMKQPFTRS